MSSLIMLTPIMYIDTLMCDTIHVLLNGFESNFRIVCLITFEKLSFHWIFQLCCFMNLKSALRRRPYLMGTLGVSLTMLAHWPSQRSSKVISSTSRPPRSPGPRQVGLESQTLRRLVRSHLEHAWGERGFNRKGRVGNVRKLESKPLNRCFVNDVYKLK